MKLQTLNYIHELLISAERKFSESKEKTYDAMKQAEIHGDKNYSIVKTKYEPAEQIYDDIKDALVDFENQDWR